MVISIFLHHTWRYRDDGTGGLLSQAPCSCVFEWERKKLLVTVWDKKKEYIPFSGLPKHVLRGAGLITLSNSQPSLWHHRSPITSQPAMTDWLCLSGLPSSWFTWSFCLYVQWSASFKTSSLDDTVGYSCNGQSRNSFPSNGSSPLIQLSGLNIKTKWPSPSAATASLLTFHGSFMRRHQVGKSQVWCKYCSY